MDWEDLSDDELRLKLEKVVMPGVARALVKYRDDDDSWETIGHLLGA